MPLDNSIKKVLTIGSGPIVIGQACEFDYSGTQACKALQEEGVKVILLNSNPATIMTDKDIADSVYIEPITPRVIEQILKEQKPDAILPIMGGQTALNVTLELEEQKVFNKFPTRLIGLSTETIKVAENRLLFKKALNEIGLATPCSVYLQSLKELQEAKNKLHFPLIVRSSFTLGGEFGGVVNTLGELEILCKKAFFSGKGLLVEESLIGWKEIELEVMRDHVGNCIVVCGIENLDPMGVHTGDSITVAPIQTLSDKEYQEIRLQAFRVMEKVGMTSGGCNVQFAIHPQKGKIYCIEMNPRVSRSSALASKATGFPIAKIAAKIALGYNLYELQNGLTSSNIPSSFEPTLDYVVTKIPKFNFEKFPDVNEELTTHMKSVGEVIAIGRTFKESFQKALKSLEIPIPHKAYNGEQDTLKKRDAKKIYRVLEALREGISVQTMAQLTGYDPWFLDQLSQIIETESEIQTYRASSIQRNALLRWKQNGFSDQEIAQLLHSNASFIESLRKQFELSTAYKRIDTCAGEFPTQTAYMYSTYEQECESAPTRCEKILVLGGGSNRIGQGIEFDYCCVHALQSIKKMGYEAIMLNCNPSTVSTDYNMADRLYLEPLAAEYVMEVVQKEKPKGVIIQFGGQTPIQIARSLSLQGVPLLGTPFDMIERSEDRDKFKQVLIELGLSYPKSFSGNHPEEVLEPISEVDFPLIVRPSFVIGGNGMQVLYTKRQLETYLEKIDFEQIKPLLVESFVENALEIEIDAIGDKEQVTICGVIEHLDRAGIHSGDSIAYLFPHSLTEQQVEKLEKITRMIGLRMEVIGCFNIQFVVSAEEIFVIEVNLRASRTVPLLAKITGYPLVEIAMHCILGKSLKSLAIPEKIAPQHLALKIPVFPFTRLGIESQNLGPYMTSTGEVMAVAKNFQDLLKKANEYSLSIRIYNEKFKELIAPYAGLNPSVVGIV